MDIEITQRTSKELVGREELEIEIAHAGEATPASDDVRRQLAAELDEDPQTVEVVSIYSSSGLPTSTGTVYIHDEPVLDELEAEEDEDEAADDESGEAEADEGSEEESDADGDDEAGDEDEDGEPDGDAEEDDAEASETDEDDEKEGDE